MKLLTSASLTVEQVRKMYPKQGFWEIIEETSPILYVVTVSIVALSLLYFIIKIFKPNVKGTKQHWSEYVLTIGVVLLAGWIGVSKFGVETEQSEKVIKWENEVVQPYFEGSEQQTTEILKLENKVVDPTTNTLAADVLYEHNGKYYERKNVEVELDVKGDNEPYVSYHEVKEDLIIYAKGEMVNIKLHLPKDTDLHEFEASDLSKNTVTNFFN